MYATTTATPKHTTKQPTAEPPSKLSACLDQTSHLHTLDCLHTITPTNPPTFHTTASSPKHPCSSNCTSPLYTLKPQLPLTYLARPNQHPRPFICPVCIEDQIRCQYARFLEEQTRKGGRVTADMESNVQLWTYERVLEAVVKGGRMCEGTVGVFRRKYVEGFRGLGKQGREEGEKMTDKGDGEDKKAAEKWEVRDHVVELEKDETPEQEVEDQEDVCGNAAVKADKAQDEDIEMEDLVDQLMDIRVDVDENDTDINVLMEDVCKLQLTTPGQETEH